MNICVFSSSSNGIDNLFFDEAKKLGQLIGERGHALVSGGANVGLMEAVTISASAAGARTIGIIPERMIQRSLASENLHEIISVKSMKARKAKMRKISDAFIALPGGFGTLEEILEVITLKQLAYHKKPVVFINTGNFYNHLFDHFEHSFSEKFAGEVYRNLYVSVGSPEEALNYIENYKPVELGAHWFIVPDKSNS